MQGQLGACPSAQLGWQPFTALPLPARRPRYVAKQLRVVNAQSTRQESWSRFSSTLPQRGLVAAMLALTAAFGLPMQAEAKKKEEPPPKPTAYDDLQKIVSGRSGNAGSLLDSFKKSVAEPVKNAVTSAAPQLPPAPVLTQPRKSEPASPPPQQSGFGSKTVQAAQRRVESIVPSPPPKLSSVAQDATEAASEVSAPPTALLGVVAALGLGGLAFFANKNKEVGTSPKQAARRAAPPVKAGTKRVGGAVKQAVKKAPSPVRSAFNSAKAQAKQPAKAAGGLFGSAKAQAKQPAKAAGGLFGRAKAERKQPARAAGGLFSSAKKQAKQPAKAAGGLFGGGGPAPSPKQVAKKIAPAATKKIKQPGTQKIGAQRAGTRPAGGVSQPSRRIQLDEDTSTTLGAASVFGLGVVVSAFLFVNALTGTETPATAKQAVEELAQKLPNVPSPLPVTGDPAQAAPKPAPPQNFKPPTITQATPRIPEGPELSLKDTPPPQSGMPLAPLPSQGAKPKAPSGPDLLVQPDSADDPESPLKKVAKEAPKAIQETVQKAAPQVTESVQPAASGAVQEQAAQQPPPATQAIQQAAPKLAEKAQDAAPALAQAIPAAAQKAQEAAPAVAEKAQEKAPALAQAVQQAAPVTAQKAQETVPEIAEQPRLSAAFEEAAKKLQSSPSAVEQFNAVVAKPADTTKKAVSNAPSPKAAISSAPSPPAGNQNTLILGGLAVAAVGAIAVAAPKGDAQGASSTESSTTESSATAAINSTGGNSAPPVADAEDDITLRKKEAKAWIAEWREQTGGK